jgi:hypothetical protein
VKHSKNLSEDDKFQQETRQELGPWKMARFVVDNVRTLKRQHHHQQQQQLNKLRNEDHNQQEDTKDSIVNNTGDIKVPDFISPIDKYPQEKDDVATLQPKPTLRIDPSLPIFACRICRTPLLDQSHLAVGHVQNLHSFRRLSKATTTTVTNPQTTPRRPCQSLFCDESVLEWLSSSSSSSSSSPSSYPTVVLEGRLSCYKCSNKLGHWKWSGSQCSCGTWVVPAIQIPLSKVDTILPIPRRNDDDDDENKDES